MHESIVVLNDVGEILFYNAKAIEFEKHAQCPFSLGIRLVDMARPERKSIVEETIRKTTSTMHTQVISVEYRDEEGRLYYIESTYDPILSEANHLEYICVMFKEKTHERFLEKRSTASSKDFSNLIETANAVIFGLDGLGYIIEWNAECARVTNFEKEDVLAQKVDLFIEENNVARFSKFFERILTGQSDTNYELLLKKKSGSPVVVLLNATPKRNENNEVVGVLFVGHDISELSQYRTSLEQKVANRTNELKAALAKEKELVDLKNRFVSMASHEFRIPLSTISSATEAISSSGLIKQEGAVQLQIIRTQVGHMRALIDDVLTLDKAGTVKIKAKNEKLELTSFLKQLADEVAANFKYSHDINFHNSSQAIEIDSDEKLLRNIFINLFSNAIKFSPGGRVIDVSIAVLSRAVAIEVRDYGIGISVDDSPNIFTAFSRGSNTGLIKGTGLGLSIVKRAVEALGGTIQMESSLGNGAVFKVTLNLSTQDEY
jgi:PAS domain S-box-containing protein